VSGVDRGGRGAAAALLAEKSGLRAGLPGALGRLRPDFAPGYDRGQVLVDLAVALGLGATSVAGAVHTLQASQAALLQVASSPTAWPAVAELDAAALAAVAKARAAHRRGMWARLAARPGGFPWVRVAGQSWTGWIVIRRGRLPGGVAFGQARHRADIQEAHLRAAPDPRLVREHRGDPGGAAAQR
jgi:hypothetical protein